MITLLPSTVFPAVLFPITSDVVGYVDSVVEYVDSVIGNVVSVVGYVDSVVGTVDSVIGYVVSVVGYVDVYRSRPRVRTNRRPVTDRAIDWFRRVRLPETADA